MNNPPEDAELLPESHAVTVRDPNIPPPAAAITPQQARIEAVADLTKTALAQAGTLKLTTEETQALIADFADEDFRPGAGGKENLIYIEHAALRDRLNQVLGLGQWAIIVRETWNENFKTQSHPPKDGVRVYARAMLLVRGAYVGEAVGDMDYYPHNASQNYGDAFEGAKTAAFRRCSKEFGVGLQAWRKDWCEAWWQRRQQGSRRPQGASTNQPSQRPAQAGKAPAAPAQAAKTPDLEALREKWKAYFLGQVKKHNAAVFAYIICMAKGLVVPGVDKLEDISAHKLPQTQPDFGKFWQEVMDRKARATEEGGMPQDEVEAFDKAYSDLAEPPPEPPKEAPAPPNQARSVPPPINIPRGVPGDTLPDEWFLKFVVPVPHAGQRRDDYLKKPDTIGGLYESAKAGNDDDRRRLFGFAEHFEPKGWKKTDGTQMPPNENDKKFRVALDAFMEWRKKDDTETPPPNDDDVPF